MKLKSHPSTFAPELDATDCGILELLQDNCKQSLATIGNQVGLSAPSVVERIHKLEAAGIIAGYVALLDAKRVGRDVTAFIGICTDRPQGIGDLEHEIVGIEDVLECHHVTGAYSLMVKVKARNTQELEELIERVRIIQGVTRTETTVVLSTAVERPRIALGVPEELPQRSARHNRRAATQRARRNVK